MMNLRNELVEILINRDSVSHHTFKSCGVRLDKTSLHPIVLGTDGEESYPVTHLPSYDI